MNTSPQIRELGCLLTKRPDAQALLCGSPKYQNISGTVNFYQTSGGVVVAASVMGLPCENGPCGWSVFGFHIHSGMSCTGNAEDAFANAGMHFNPADCEHPRHAGDLPPLFGNKGCALMSVLTNRFTVAQVCGRAVIIHGSPDDFTTQPSGNSGEKIACGTIRPLSK
ncbi:MAG: superoxide dismutase family protein [Oscillospiraceae bacterium]|nr:superoxide dismutase family protein [Oscillospiraceae bacterium]